jgi:MFS transporter, FHS family, L-fucose permease
VALYGIFFFMSAMFPTIFALGIRNLGPDTKRASSWMVMSIVGGAIFPLLMGYIADHHGMAAGFLAPLPLFGFILYYALWGSNSRAV